MTTPPNDPYGASAPQGGAGGIDPGEGLGKVGKILSIIPCTTVIGFILNLVAYFQSKNAGFKNQHSKTGFTFNIIWAVVYIIFWIVYAVAIIPMMANA
jgi:hypothetical protein